MYIVAVHLTAWSRTWLRIASPLSAQLSMSYYDMK